MRQVGPVFAVGLEAPRWRERLLEKMMQAHPRFRSVSPAPTGTQARLVLVEEGAGIAPPPRFEADAIATVVVSALADTPARLARRIEHCLAELQSATESLSDVLYLVGSTFSERSSEQRLTALRTVVRALPEAGQEVVLVVPASSSAELCYEIFELVECLMMEFGARTRIRINFRPAGASRSDVSERAA